MAVLTRAILDGLGFDARGIILAQSRVWHLHRRVGGVVIYVLFELLQHLNGGASWAVVGVRIIRRGCRANVFAREFADVFVVAEKARVPVEPIQWRWPADDSRSHRDRHAAIRKKNLKLRVDKCCWPKSLLLACTPTVQSSLAGVGLRSEQAR